MDTLQIQRIFSHNNLGVVEKVEKIAIGFTNKVYSINNEYIFKVCGDEENEGNFEREVFLYNFFRDTLPVPKIIVFDSSKKFLDKHFMIYHKIPGENLYSRWHLMSNKEREEIVKQICDILKIINETDYTPFLKHYKLDHQINWRDKVYEKIKNSVQKIKGKNIISNDFLKRIKEFVDQHKEVLSEQKIALVYWDAHFDNILISGNKVVGLLDFERTELSSIDFVLDIFKRMMDYPKKYMSEETEQYAKKEDYAQLFIWLREYYPTLFAFSSLDQRLLLYSIEHDLDTLIWYPDSTETKEMIAKSIHFQGVIR